MRAVVLGALMDGATVLDPERRWTEGGWTTRSDDSSRPNQVFKAGLLNRSFDVSARLGCVFWGDQSALQIGAIELANADRSLDVLLTLGVRNRTLEVRSGDPSAQWSAWREEFAGIAESVEFSERSCRIVAADKAQRFDRPINTTNYTSGPLSGRPIPIAIGMALNVPAQLSNLSTLQYDVAESSSATTLLVRDQGVELTPLTQWTGSGNGFTLGQSPVGLITADVQGRQSTTSGRDSDTLRGFVQRVFELLGLTPSLHSDVSGDLGLSYQLGFFADAPVTGRQVLDMLAASYGAGWLFDSQGQLRIVPITAPSSAKIVIPETQVVGIVEATPDTAKGFSPVCAARRNWRQHSPSEIAGTLTDPTYQTIAAELQRAYRVYARGAAVSSSADLSAENLEAESARVSADVGIGTLLQVGSDAQAEADRWRDLYKVRRTFYSVSVLSTTDILALELGEVVELTVPQVGRGALAVRPFGLSAKPLMVVGYERRGTDAATKLILWG